MTHILALFLKRRVRAPVAGHDETMREGAMRNQIPRASLFVLLAILMASTAWAVEPADSIIANAQTDLERYQSQASALTPGRAAGANRILKLMNLSYERLAGSPNQSDPSWIEVNEGYIALQEQLENLLNPSTSASSSPAATAQSVPSSSAPAAVVSSPGGQSVPPLVSGQRVQVKKLARDLANSRSSIVITGPSHFQDPAVVAARQKSLKQYTDAIGRYPQADDPDVQAARAEYLAFREALLAEFERAKSQLAQLGDVQASLKQLDENRRAYPVPRPLMVPFSAEDAQQWVSEASSARTVAEHNAKQIAIIEPLAYLPINLGTPGDGSPYDANDLKGLQFGATDTLTKIQANYETMADSLSYTMDGMNNGVLLRWQEDPNDDSKRWLFIGEGKQQEAMEVYAENRTIVNSSIYLEEALGRDPVQAKAMLAKLDQAEADFDRKRQEALEGSRLPEPATRNKDMMKIAQQVVSNPKYEFGEHGDIVLTTSEIVERERKDSEIDIDDAELTLSGDLKMSGTETTWTYKWKEFKFATPLKEEDSDEWYIWWITAKNFSSGGNNTPLNRWISGGATKGNLILQKNM